MIGTDDEDDEVGYGRPPKAHRFRKGRSGNPRGRPKGSRNIGKMLEDVLSKTQVVREDGEVKRLSNAEIMLRQLVTKALKGDLRATSEVVALCQRYGVLGDDAASASVAVEADDRALIQAYLDRAASRDGRSDP